MKRYLVSVIGVGNMGKNHLRVYSEIPSVQVVSISDTNSELVKSLAVKYNVNAYTNFHRMLDEEKIDAVSICVPTFWHYEIAMECMGRGISVLLEKPITDNVDQASNLLEFSRKKNVRLLVGHIERFNPMVSRIKDIVGVGQIGKVIAIIARRVGRIPPQILDADVATDLAIHDIDICNYLLEELPVKVTKSGQRSLAKNRDDSVEFFLKYGSGASAYIQANWITPVKIRKLIVTGNSGHLEADYVSQEIEIYQINESEERRVIKIIPDKKEPLKEELLYFLNCIESGAVIDSQFAVEALRIALNL